MKLLIVDDEPLIRQGLRIIEWEKIGIKLCGVVENGIEALHLAEKESPDIVLTDIRMPGMDGITLSKKLCERNPRCCIIFLSGYSDFEYARQAIQLNVYDYILKPTNPEEILECVKRAMNFSSRKQSEQVLLSQAAHLMKHEEITEKLPDPDLDQGHASGLNVQEILAFLEQHFAEDISLNDLSVKFHFNSIYINRVLKKETGSTYLVLLNNIRLQHAMELLSGTDLKITVIAEMCGFSDHRYFSQIFRKNLNCTPAQFRKIQSALKNGDGKP